MSPIGFLICGPSGVGKSSNINIMLENAGINKELIEIDPDKRKEETHEERSKAAIDFVKYTIDKGYSFYYTATCGGMRTVTDLIERMKNSKYRVIVAIVYTSLPVALNESGNEHINLFLLKSWKTYMHSLRQRPNDI